MNDNIPPARDHFSFVEKSLILIARQNNTTKQQ